MNKPPDRKALGKGLSALLPSRSARTDTSETSSIQLTPAASGLQQIPIEQIEPNPLQPRTVFQPDRLAELAQSIRANGIIQPLVIQRAGDHFQMVAGERRWRAAKLAGLTHVPAVIQEVAADRLLEVALIENIQREDLNPIEIAHALESLARDHNLSHEEIGQRTGKDRTTVSNLLRLLKLPQAVQLLVAEQRLSMGHARAILGLSSEELQVDLAQKTAAEGLSVRQVERLVQSATSKRETPTSLDKPSGQAGDPNVTAATRELEAALGTRVRIVAHSSDRGRIEIEYFSADELDRLYNFLIGSKN